MENGSKKKNSEMNTGKYHIKEADKLKAQIKIKLDKQVTSKNLKEIDNFLKKLNDIEPIEPSVSIDDEWQDFKNNYLPRINEGKMGTVKKVRYRITAIAVIVIILISVNIISVAAGLNIFEPFLKWTSEILNLKADEEYIITDDGTKNFSDISSLEEYLNESIPKLDLSSMGYDIFNIELNNTETINIDYEGKAGDFIKYKIIAAGNDLNTFIEKNESSITEINFNDRNYNYFKNNRWSVIEWNYNNRIFYVTGDFSENEAVEIIKNIKY